MAGIDCSGTDDSTVLRCIGEAAPCDRWLHALVRDLSRLKWTSSPDADLDAH
jgi:hypothetical protein